MWYKLNQPFRSSKYNIILVYAVYDEENINHRMGNQYISDMRFTPMSRPILFICSAKLHYFLRKLSLNSLQYHTYWST